MVGGIFNAVDVSKFQTACSKPNPIDTVDVMIYTWFFIASYIYIIHR